MLARSTLFHVNYMWDYNGNLTHINGREQTYDGLERLTTGRIPTSAGTHTVSYTYDKAGNRLTEAQGGVTRTYVYNTLDQLTSITAGTVQETFAYAASGAVAARTKSGVTAQYSYDPAVRLIEVRQAGQPMSQYMYDAYGRLIKTVEGSSTILRLPVGTETAYEKVLEGSNVLERKYIRGNGMYLAKVERLNGGPWQTFHYHTDHLGSTRAVSGAHISQLTYDPFGNLIDFDANAEAHEHRFTGKPQDGTGLYYYGARFYDPTIGRFISPDPAMDGLNWYVYVANNPLKHVDPDGMRVRVAGEDILVVLQRLSHDTLSMDAEGYVSYARGRGDLPVGTSLVRALINWSETVTIDQKSGSTGTYQPHTNTIRFNPVAPSAPTIPTTEGFQAMDPHIVLGHELVHAWRDMKGWTMSSSSNTKVFTWYTIDGKSVREPISHEERHTIGLNTITWFRPTENKLRREHGLPQRIGYDPQGLSMF